jgi:ATP/maltotriose-dependent transcriptional regulator MalT
VREFAQAQLSPDELISVQRTHATFYRDLAERLEPVLLGKDETIWLRLYDAEMGNLRQALEWGLQHEPELSLRLGGATRWFWNWFYLAEGRSWLTLALDAAPDASPLYRVRALNVVTSIAVLTGDVDSLQQLMPAFVEAANLSESWPARASAGWMQSLHLFLAGDIDQGYEIGERALSHLDSATSPSDVSLAAYMRSTCGDMAFLRGHWALGISHFELALEQLRRTGGSCIPVIVFSNFAGWLLSLGMVQRAREVLQEAVGYTATSAVTWQSAITLVGLALADALEGKTVTAARRLGATEAIRIRADLVIPVHYQVRMDQATQLARDDLGALAFQREWERGLNDPLAFVATMREDAAALHVQRNAELARELGLTLRESEVLGLVAAGMSDRDIADKLFISVRTASKHVGSILVKMGVTSRAEAAVRAMQLGLA